MTSPSTFFFSEMLRCLFHRCIKRIKAFTLIEVLIVIVIIGVAASAVFVALDPAKRLGETRDTLRFNDVNAIRQAEELYRADNGKFLPSIETLLPNTNYMIGTAGPSCTQREAGSTCDVFIGASNCADITGLSPTYLATMPIAAKMPGGAAWNNLETGYWLRKSSTGAFLIIGACDAENTESISTSTSGINNPPLVSSISSNTPDADIATPGVQYLEGTTVTYTASISDPDGDLVDWEWMYSKNGLPNVTYLSGTGVLQDLVYPYGQGEAGNVYQWTLKAQDRQLTSQAAFTNTIVSPDQVVDSGLGDPGDFSPTSPRKGFAQGAGYAGDFVPAKVENGLRIDGAGEYGRYPQRNLDGARRNVELDKGSAEFWYYPFSAHTDGVRHPLFSTGTWLSPGSLHLVKENTNALVAHFYNSVGTLSSINRISSTNYSFTPNTWTHIRATWDFTVPAGTQNIRVYLDGQETPLETGFSTGPMTMADEDPSQYIWIGSRDGGIEHGNGIFDELKVYRVSGDGTDTIKPSQPASVSLSILSPSQVSISWAPSKDNRKVTGYRIYRCQGIGCAPVTQVGVASTPENVIDTVPVPGMPYTWAISAYDRQGNESPPSIKRSASMLEINNPPLVSSISSSELDKDANTLGIQYYQNTTATYSASASDPDGDPVTWQWTYTVNGGDENSSASGTGALAPTPPFSYGPSTLGNTYLWMLNVSDGKAAIHQTLAVNIVDDVSPPSVTITSPQNNTTITAGATVSITATASDDNGIVGVQFLIDDVNFGAEDIVAPYTIAWDTTAVSGTHTLKARARDTQGGVTTSVGVSITVSGTMGGGSCGPLAASGGSIITVSPAQASQLPTIVAGAPSGTTILLQDGTYSFGNDILRFLNPYVTLRSQSGNRDAVILDGQYVTNSMINIKAPFITIADLTIMRVRWHTIHFVGNGNNALIYNLHLVDSSQQLLKANGSGTPIAYNDYSTVACSLFELTDTGRQNVDTLGGTYPCYTGGIDAHNSRGWHIRDNTFQNIYCTNNSLAEHAVHFWDSSRDTLVERNTIINNARGIGFGLDETWDATARVYPDNPLAGISGYVGHIGGIIKNNFISGTIGAYFSLGIGLEQALDAKVYNNTVYSNGGTFSSIDANYANTNAIIKNNFVSLPMTVRNGANPTRTSNVETATAGMFVNPGAGDLHLNASAVAAINQGEVLSEVPDDIDGASRGSQPDIGADEFVPGSGDTENPTVAFTSPTNNATVSNTITLAASASDNVGVAGVQFFRNGAGIGAEDTTSPYSISWDTRAVANGAYALSAVARDAAGNTATAVVNITVSNTLAGPIASYGFEENTGTKIGDASGNLYTGNFTNIANPPTATSGWTTQGQFGNAIRFDGIDDYVNLGGTVLGSGASQLTVMAWVNKADTTGDDRVVAKSDSGSSSDPDYIFSLNVGGLTPRARVRTSPTGNITNINGTDITANAWVHLAMTYDGATLRLYQGGAQTQSAAISGPIPASSIAAVIGNNDAGINDRYFNGRIDEVRIYTRALTQTEIQSDMNTAVGLGTIPPPDTTPPSVPTNLTATPVSSSRIDLSWSASSDAESGIARYRLERCTGADCTNYAEIAQPAAATYSDTTLVADTLYRYRVRAENGDGLFSGYSVPVEVRTLLPGVGAPTVTITSPLSNAEIIGSVTVAASASDNVGVLGVAFFADGVQFGSEDTAADVGGQYTRSWDAIAAGPGPHTLTARARDGDGNTTFSAPIPVTVVLDTTPPTDPTNLTATPLSSFQINLSWTASTDVGGIGNYLIERCQGAGCSNFVLIAIAPGSQTTYLNGGLPGSTAYTYRLRARDTSQNLSTAYSNTASAQTLAQTGGGAPMSGPMGTRTTPYAESKCSDPNVFFCEDFEDAGTAPIRTSFWGGCDGNWRNPAWASSSYCFNTTGVVTTPAVAIPGFPTNKIYQINMRQGTIDGRLKQGAIGRNYSDYYIRYQFYYSSDVQWPTQLDIKQMLSHPEEFVDPPSANFQNGPFIYRGYSCSGLGNFADALSIRYGTAYDSFPLLNEYCPPLAPGAPANNINAVRLERNRWYTVETHFVLSPDPAVGLLEAWLDGNLMYRVNRATCTGSCPPMSYVYWTGYKGDNDPDTGYVQYDNLIMSRSYIGPPTP